LATFDTPSMVKSFFFSPTPSVENCDRPLLKAALRDRRSVVTVTPGARITSSTGLPSRMGSSAIRLASTTCPSSAVLRSIVAATAVTLTSSVSAPTCSDASTVSRSATCTSMRLLTNRLNPSSATVTV
jgi:hypothetical protein